MSFFHKKMSQNVWATIMPFGPVTLLAQQICFRHCLQYIGTSTKIVNIRFDQ